MKHDISDSTDYWKDLCYAEQARADGYLEKLSMPYEIGQSSDATFPIGKAIRAARCARGLSLDDLADRMGCRHSNISRIERGESNPGMSMVVKISHALGYPAYRIVRYAENMKRHALRVAERRGK
ncbi:MAG: helix-turn-helix domain-containing protein [Gemmatimonadales bacterium]